MSFNRSASRFAPLLLRNGTRTAFARSIQGSRQVPAIAILVPHRAVSTETSTSGGQGNYPPPGFNAEQAKKPLPKDTHQQSTAAKEKESHSAQSVSIPSNEPTEHAPTTAAEEKTVADLAAKNDPGEKTVALKSEKKKEDDKKLTLRQRIMKEVHHYWDGTKLLGTEIKISSKLALKMAAGYELTRREHRQVRCYLMGRT